MADFLSEVLGLTATGHSAGLVSRAHGAGDPTVL